MPTAKRTARKKENWKFYPEFEPGLEKIQSCYHNPVSLAPDNLNNVKPIGLGRVGESSAKTPSNGRS